MGAYRHLVTLGKYIDTLPIPPPTESVLVGHTLHIERDVITALVATHRDQREYFFSVPSDTHTLTLDDLILVGSGTGTSDEHDSTIDASQLSGHTHPNVENRSVSPPSSYDVHSMIHAMKRAIVNGNERFCCSHLIVAPEGVYVVTIHPVWALQPNEVIDWTLHEQYQSFDVILGGIPETRQSPLLSRSTYQAMTRRMGIPVQFSDDMDGNDDFSFVIYTAESRGIEWSPMYAQAQPEPDLEPDPEQHPRQNAPHRSRRRIQF